MFNRVLNMSLTRFHWSLSNSEQSVFPSHLEIILGWLLDASLLVVSNQGQKIAKKWSWQCVKGVHTRSYSGPHFSRIFPHSDWIRIDTLRIQSNAGKCGKNADQNNSKYGHFLRSVSGSLKIILSVPNHEVELFDFRLSRNN